MTNLDSILKSRDITSPTMVHLVKALVFPESCIDVSWTIKKAECLRIDAFKLVLEKTLESPWTERRSNQSVLKELIGKTEAEAETAILWPPDAKN